MSGVTFACMNTRELQTMVFVAFQASIDALGAPRYFMKKLWHSQKHSRIVRGWPVVKTRQLSS